MNDPNLNCLIQTSSSNLDLVCLEILDSLYARFSINFRSIITLISFFAHYLKSKKNTKTNTVKDPIPEQILMDSINN